MIVAAPFRGSVTREMLRAGENGVRRREIVALESPDAGPGDERPEVGVLPALLHDAAPARVAGDVYHRCESPTAGPLPSFDGGHPGRGFDGLHIPRTTLGEGHGRNSFIAVDYVQREDQGNAQPGLLDGDPLEFAGRRGARDVEHGADFSLADAPLRATNIVSGRRWGLPRPIPGSSGRSSRQGSCGSRAGRFPCRNSGRGALSPPQPATARQQPRHRIL